MRRRSAIHEPAGRIDEDRHLHIRHFPGNIRRDLSFHDALSQIFHIGAGMLLGVPLAAMLYRLIGKDVRRRERDGTARS